MYEQAVCDEHNLTLTNTIYGSSTIAEYGFALLMNICHHVDLHNDYIQRTDWSAPNMSEDEFCHTLTPQVELFGKTIGIVGLGNIGLHMAEIARSPDTSHGSRMNHGSAPSTWPSHSTSPT